MASDYTILLEQLDNTSLGLTADDILDSIREKNVTSYIGCYEAAMFAKEMNQLIPFEAFMKHAIWLKPDSENALVGLATLLLNYLNRTTEATPYLESLLQHYPNNTNGLMLMGQVNVQVNRDLAAAEKNYKKIIELEPGNFEARHSLCVVYLKANNLQDAEKCLVDALQLKPDSELTKRKLDKIRNKIGQQSSQDEKTQQ